MRVLVCGGAGYIGAHVCCAFAEAGHEVVALDNLSTGHRAAVRWGPLVEADLLDRDALLRALRHYQIEAVIHLAARSIVAESVQDPAAYQRNNVLGSLNLLAAMREADVQRMVFSSTAAVYGNPQRLPIPEDHPKAPINPYGQTKWAVEQALQKAALDEGLRSASLRYFNAAGAHADQAIGESHQPETHLIPNVLRGALTADADLRVSASAQPTRDGSCVRDYVHVRDLAHAHLLALEHLDCAPGAHAFNLGTGRGYSSLEVVHAARRVTELEIPYEMAPPRPGDPPTLVADPSLAGRVLGWQPVHSDLDSIISSAWDWHRKPAY
jgi:UDP-glucose 4-epimerase